MNHLKIIKATLAKWSLYKEWRAPSGRWTELRAPSGHDTKKGQKAHVITRQERLGKNPKRTGSRRVDRKKEDNKHSHIRDSVAKKQQSVSWRLEIKR